MNYAISSGHRALELAQELGDPVLIASARHFLVGVYHTLGQYKEAIRIGLDAAHAGEELVAKGLGRGVLGIIPWFLAPSYAQIGGFTEALSIGEALMRRAEAVEHPFSIVGLCIALGLVHLRRGTANEAITFLERGINLCRTCGLDT